MSINLIHDMQINGCAEKKRRDFAWLRMPTKRGQHVIHRCGLKSADTRGMYAQTREPSPWQGLA